MSILLDIMMTLFSLGMGIYIFVLIKKSYEQEIVSKRIRILETVSAGSASKEIQSAEIKIEGYRFRDSKININNFITLLVCGSSMENENIENGDVVMVEECCKDKLKKNNIILVKNESEGEMVKHKLRKYINVFDSVDIQFFANKNNLKFDVFQECYNKSEERIKELQKQSKELVVSETFTEDKKLHYSFHSYDLIEGIVKHAIPSKYITVINKE